MKMKMIGISIFVAAMLLSCGPQDRRTHGTTPDGEPWVLRGEMWMGLSQTEGNRMYLSSKPQEYPQPVAGTVAERVRFKVSNANFKLPENLDGILSYGSLDLVDLYDNNLRVCGQNGRAKCKKAMIKVFTRGEGPGFWNSEDEYGAPITTEGNVIGLEPQGLAFRTIEIGLLKFVVKLKDFAAPELQVPFSIDFTDAPMGTYSTTLVIQYLLQ